MQIEMLLISILPLVLFVFIEIKYGLKAGIWTAIVSAILGGTYYYFKTNTFDSIALIEIALILIMGLISLKMKNDRVIKFQPVVMSVIISAYTLYLQLFSQPILMRVSDIIKDMDLPGGVNPQDILGEDLLRRMSAHLIILFLLHGLLVWWGALHCKSSGWLITRLAIYPMLFIFVIFQMIFR